MFNIARIEELTNKDIEQLLALWERSVRASHHFLSETDITNIRPQVKPAFEAIEHLILVMDTNKVVAFMGLENKKIEMLFVDPDYFTQGIGKKLLCYAVEHFSVNLVDVNEQNIQAFAFYTHMGFKVFSRSELDEQGNPFPLLHLQIENKLNSH